MTELTYDIEEFRTNLLSEERKHRDYTRTLFIAAILAFVIGGVLTYLGLVVVAIICLALGVLLYQSSNHHLLLGDMLQSHWSLALLINKQSKQLEVLRWELGGKQGGRS